METIEWGRTAMVEAWLGLWNLEKRQKCANHHIEEEKVTPAVLEKWLKLKIGANLKQNLVSHESLESGTQRCQFQSFPPKHDPKMPRNSWWSKTTSRHTKTAWTQRPTPLGSRGAIQRGKQNGNSQACGKRSARIDCSLPALHV